MSCDRRCYDDDDPMYEHDDCATCPGRDDGQSAGSAQRRDRISERLVKLADIMDSIADDMGHLAGDGEVK